MKCRCLFSLFLISIALAWAAQPGSAQVVGNAGDSTLLVYPKGIHPDDVTNVQWALDNVASPGTVLMKSTDMSGNPLAFNFGGTTPGTGGVLKLVRPDITLTGDGWDDVLDEPKTKIVNGGGPFKFSPSASGAAMLFAVRAPGVTIREIKLNTAFAYTGVLIVSTTGFAASSHPVVIERNHINVVTYGVIAMYTAAFPVKIDGNRMQAQTLVEGRWIGFTLKPITIPSGFAYDEPVVPQDASGNPVRYPFEVTNNTMLKTGSTGTTLIVWGWQNYYNGPAGADMTDPDLGCRRFRESSSSPWIYQCVAGDNGPVLISGNSITLEAGSSPAITIAWGDAGLNHAVVTGNAVSGTCYIAIRRFGYGHDTMILDNDLSGVLANHHIVVYAADTVVAYNVFGPQLPFEPPGMPLGLPQPAMYLNSTLYYPGYQPMPRPTENCVIMENDYRLTGINNGAILLASTAETYYPTGAGTEVKNNLIFESGNFPWGTGGASSQVTLLNTMINPDTGLPYVHDNRIVGLSAERLNDPGIGQIIKKINEIRKALKGK